MGVLDYGLLVELYNWNRRRRIALRAIKPADASESSSDSDEDDAKALASKFKIAKKRKPGTFKVKRFMPRRRKFLNLIMKKCFPQ